jgi:hypothetical protein
VYSLLAVLISACTSKNIMHKTALLSFPEIFCDFTETSGGFAYIQFAYQDSGKIKYVRTKTDCTDFENMSHAEKGIFGEQIILNDSVSPTSITRENGDQYRIEPSDKIRSFFTPGTINVYYNPKDLPPNSAPGLVIQECKLLNNPQERNICLSYQAALQKDTSICKDSTCRQWVKNIIGGLTNK